MKNTFVPLVAAAVMCATALAQNSPPPATNQNAPQAQPATGAEAANAPRIAPGSVIPVQLTRTIDAKKAKTGEEVVALVTQDMKNENGQVLVPKATKVTGHVTEAQARNKDQKESQLAIAFDHALLNNEQVQLPMSIQAVVAPPQNNANDNASPSSGTPSPASPAGGSSSPMGGNRSGMGNSQSTAQQPAPQSGDSDNPPPAQGKLPPINGQTQGVIGISHMSLAAGSTPTQGSVLTSDKNNVKLESGTMLLLKVQPNAP
jgi:hypothetical protein